MEIKSLFVLMQQTCSIAGYKSTKVNATSPGKYLLTIKATKETLEN